MSAHLTWLAPKCTEVEKGLFTVEIADNRLEIVTQESFSRPPNVLANVSVAMSSTLARCMRNENDNCLFGKPYHHGARRRISKHDLWRAPPARRPTPIPACSQPVPVCAIHYAIQLSAAVVTVQKHTICRVLKEQHLLNALTNIARFFENVITYALRKPSIEAVLSNKPKLHLPESPLFRFSAVLRTTWQSMKKLFTRMTGDKRECGEGNARRTAINE